VKVASLTTRRRKTAGCFAFSFQQDGLAAVGLRYGRKGHSERRAAKVFHISNGSTGPTYRRDYRSYYRRVGTVSAVVWPVAGGPLPRSRGDRFCVENSVKSTAGFKPAGGIAGRLSVRIVKPPERRRMCSPGSTRWIGQVNRDVRWFAPNNFTCPFPFRRVPECPTVGWRSWRESF
jgi:hypothetical protein